MGQTANNTGASIFLRNFDTEIAQEIADRASEGPKSFSEADVARAAAEAEARGHAAGVAQGHAAGLAEARGEINASIAASLETLAPLVSGFVQDIDTVQSALEQQMLGYAMGLCETLFPQLLQEFGNDRVADRIAALIARLQGRATLTVSLPSSVADEIAQKVTAMIGDGPSHCHLEMTADPTLEPGQAQLKWADGFAAIDQAALTAAILRDLRRACAASSENISTQPVEQECST